MRRALLLALVVIGLLAGMAATRWLTAAPGVRAQNGPGQFDAVRAKARLARVLGVEAPHPADSAASDGVRERLVAELRAAGLDPRVDDRFACNRLHKQTGVSCARVRNVMVTIGAASSSAPHVLVNSHYDSVPVGPGASDAGLGVAAMIEAAALMKDRPLARPMTFLFNEGEELGLIGARAFLDGDPLSRRVDALINLEARGTTGPVNMFETSVPNAAAVRLFGDSVSRPVANSLAVSAYRLIPNYTDVNTFVEERPEWLFLNFAPIGNETRYHSPGDDLAALDLATLQHMGDQLLEVGTAMGSAATPRAGGGVMGEHLFMNIGTRWLFALPMGVALAALVGAVAVWWVRRRKAVERAPLRPVLTAIPLLVAALLLPVLLAWLGLTAVGAARAGHFWRAMPQATEFAIYAGVVAGGFAMLALARRWSQSELRRAWWLLFVALGLLLAIAAPGALIYFLLPPLLFWLATAVGSRWRHAETVGAIIAALLLFVTLGAMLGLLQDLLNGGPLWAFALLGGLVLMPWLIEARPLLSGWSWRRVVPVAAALAALAWLPAALVPAYSADRQQQWTTQYVIEAGRAPLWSIVNDRKPLPPAIARQGEWALKTLPLGRRLRWLAPAPLASGFALPSVAILSSTAANGRRTIALRLAMNGADSVSLSSKRPELSLTCTGRSCDGRTVTVSTGPAPLDVELSASQWRLPPSAAPLLAARPRHARPQYLPDATLLFRRLRI